MKRLSILAATAAAFVLTGSVPAMAQQQAQAQAPQLERIDGKPNLNGIWQVMNTANWNSSRIRRHQYAQKRVSERSPHPVPPPCRG